MQTLKQQYAADSEIFEHEDCPYDRETVDILKAIFKVRVETVEVEKPVYVEVEKRGSGGGVTDTDMGVVEDELRLCLDQIRGLNKETEQGAARKDDETMVKIIKAKAGLIEQVVKLRERVVSVRRQAEFESTVIRVLEDLVGEDNRTEFLRRLEPFRDA